MINNNLTNVNLNRFENFENKTDGHVEIIKSAVATAALVFSIGFHNSTVNKNLEQNVFGSRNSMFLPGIEISAKKNQNTTFINEEVTLVDTESRTFGQLEQKVTDLEKLATNIQDIQKDIHQIQVDIASIPKKEDLNSTIEAALNKAKLKAIVWFIATGIALAGVTIAAIKLF